ncbi:septation protein A [Novispirillum itersonii]|uniref:Inner membrane-spanning protein YciB n=1 Tax=Novispirillum itersonii TaxID=189 RepID=A0A7W9ZH86_NOVIT|nr:septation protein A [Novispirillum itersonii]MBB6211431.1 intracellular septation protein [Novispirillum itersonii]
MPQWVKFALEMGPLLVFFVANSRFGIVTGTAVFMVATAVALAASWLLARKIPVLPLVSGVFVLVFGGLTVWLQDDLFIKLKPTIVNTLFGLILLGGLATGRNFLKMALDTAFQVTEEGWRILAVRWGLFFLALAVINEVVWRSVATDVWVNFKVFGIMPLTVVFSLTQIPVLLKHQIQPEENGQEESIGDGRA